MTAEYKITEGALLKYSNDGPGTFEGYAAVFGNRDLQGDRIVQGAFAKHLPEFIKRGFVGWNHEKTPIGTISNAREDSRGLHITGQFHSDKEAQRIRSIVSERVARGAVCGMSIGYYTINQRKSRDANELIEIKPFEASILSTYPANLEAGVTAVKSAGGPMDQQQQRKWNELLAKVKPGGFSWSQNILSSMEFKQAKSWGMSGSVHIKAAGDPIAGFDITASAARIDAHAFKPSGVLELLPRATISTSSLIYTQTVYPLTNTAAFVAEGGLKPEIQPRWVKATVKCEECATWCAVTREALEDVPSLERTIDIDLAAALDDKIADRVINGTGAINDLLGLLFQPGVQSVAYVALTTIIDSIYKGIDAIATPGYGVPNGIVLSPSDALALATLKVSTTGAYAMGPPQLPVIVTDAHLAAGTAIVGDFRFATLYQRGGVNFEVGYKGADLLSNILTIAPSQRVGLALSRPQAFAKVALA